jgi:uncharacterized protein YyaL (SSP411 family)
MKLAILSSDPAYQRRAVTVLRTMRQAMSKYPASFGYLLCALDFYLSEPKEIALIGKTDSHEIRSFVEEIYSRFLPNKVIAAAEEGDRQASAAIKLLEGRTSVDGKPAAYVCRNYTCLLPATTVEELAARLRE